MNNTNSKKTTTPRKLLILDLDETLFHASLQPLLIGSDFVTDTGYHVYVRPYLVEFLAFCFENFDVAVWTSATQLYAEEIVNQLFPNPKALQFLWHRQHCITRFNPESGQYDFIKDLQKVKRKGFDLNAVLAVDDSPEKLARQYGNLIQVNPFFGIADQELFYLKRYLMVLKDKDNIRKIEKRAWHAVSAREGF